MYLFDYARRSEVLLHSHRNKGKQSALIARLVVKYATQRNATCLRKCPVWKGGGGVRF